MHDNVCVDNICTLQMFKVFYRLIIIRQMMRNLQHVYNNKVAEEKKKARGKRKSMSCIHLKWREKKKKRILITQKSVETREIQSNLLKEEL